MSNTYLLSNLQKLRKARLYASLGRLLGRAANARLGRQVITLSILVILWEIGGRGVMGKTVFVPAFSEVLSAWWRLVLRGTLQLALLQSLQLLFVGFGLSLVLGVLSGVLMARYRKIEYLLGGYINFFLASPQVAYIPLVIILFGIGFWSRVVALVLFVLFMINVNTFVAMRDCDASLIEMAESFGANERQLFWKVMLPDALPLILEGIRLGAIQAVKGMIVVEMLVTLSGLGYLTRYYAGAFATDALYAVVLTIVVIALLVSGATYLFERRLFRWTRP